MIVGSVLLVIAAGVLLGLGLVFLDGVLLYSAIGVSVLAALTLVAGVRRLAAVRAGRGMIAVRPAGASVRPASPVRSATATGRATPRPVGRAAVTSPAAPADGVVAGDLHALAQTDPTVPVDEPAEETVTAADAARIERLDAAVVVIDGRPRYHLAECLHPLGLDSEPLPVSEAVELGFTPCGLCRPVSALLRAADALPDAGDSTLANGDGPVGPRAPDGS